MNKFTFSALLVLFCIFSSSAQNGSKTTTTSQVPQTGKINWSVDPFEHALFVENKGQFDTILPGGKIFFEAKLPEGIDAYFTAKGVLYQDIQTEPLDFSHGDPDQDGPPKRDFYYFSSDWLGASSNVTVDAADELPYYYTYPKGTHDTYFVNVFKKITYHNIYPGIDVVYSFPQGNNHLEYTIIVHPGADLSKVQLKYANTSEMHVDGAGNVLVKNEIGTLNESAPVSYYQEDHSAANVKAQTNTPIELFTAHNIDASKTLIIDPVITWTTNPGFTGTYDYAYDLDYDNLGNVYAYGGGAYPLQLVKLNAAGAIQWTFNATTMTASTDFYGDFAVDKHSLECYTTEGWNASGGGRVEKISPLGALIATDAGAGPFNEIWRIESSKCPQGFVMYGNGTCCPDHSAMLDTTMATMTPVNILGPTCTTGYHDMALTAVDPFGGFSWTECTHSLVYTTWNNYLIKSPMPALAPSVYQTPIHYSFYEIGSMKTPYYPSNLVFNAMNGLVAGRAWLYSYNSDTIKQINKNTGAINAVVQVSAIPFTCGGIDVDLCDNIYAANMNAIQVYSPTLALTSTLPTLAGTIYDLQVGEYTNQVVYACGQNFVSSISLGPPATIPIVITKTPSNCSACSGTATASAMPCGILDTLNVTYKWSDGETTRTASHLCSGVDTVHVSIECGLTYSDTVTIPVISGGIVVTNDSVAATCLTLGSASVNVTGGHPPYTYDWSNGSSTSSTGPVGAGTYCVGVRDNAGCLDSVCIIVPGIPHPSVAVTPSPDTICPGVTATLTANVTGGLSPYAYLWTSGSTISTSMVSPASTTTYTVTATDANGCSNSTSVIVDVLTDPIVNITAPNDTICLGGAGVTLTASGAVSYTWAPGGATGQSILVNPTVTTTYTVTGANSHGCTNTATFTVIALEPLTLVVTPNMGICPGRTVTLNAHQTSGAIGTFVWSPGGSTAQSITITPTTSETYTVTCTNSCGAVSKEITVNVLPLPKPLFEANPYQGCAPLCIQFRNFTSISSGKIVEWEWTFGNGDTSLTQQPVYCYPKSGSYNVTLTAVSDSGCSSTLKINNMITVYTKPVANFIASPQPTDILSPAIQFTDESTDAYGIVYWGWNFGDNRGDSSISALENPSHTYADTGTFCVKLGIINPHGCIDTAIDCIVIDPIFALYIPSAFSPNGNGLNDVFMAKGNDVKTFEMYIFDRWGAELFHSTSINDGWPGTVNGGSSICQEDTYIYLIKVTDHKNKLHSYTGRVTLIK